MPLILVSVFFHYNQHSVTHSSLRQQTSERYCHGQVEDYPGRLFTNTGGGVRTGVHDGVYAVQGYELNVPELQRYLECNGKQLVLNKDRPRDIIERINDHLESHGITLPIERPTSDAYRNFRERQRKRQHLKKKGM